MARVSVPEGADLQPVLPAGNYAEGCRIVTSEVREVPGKNEGNETYLDIGVAIPSTGGMVFAHTTPFGKYHCRLTKGSGSKVEQFLANIGQNPRDFDPEELVGTNVAVEVNLRQFKTKSGEEGQRNEIMNLGRT
jgi:hypothetical protein